MSHSDTCEIESASQHFTPEAMELRLQIPLSGTLDVCYVLGQGIERVHRAMVGVDDVGISRLPASRWVRDRESSWSDRGCEDLSGT